MSYLEKIPELARSPMNQLLIENEKFGSYSNEMQEFLIIFVLGKLSEFFNSPDAYGATNEEKISIANTWAKSLNELSFKSIMSGLYQILSGRTGFVEFPPRHGIAFLNLCRNGDHNLQISPPSDLKALPTPEYDYEAKKSVAEENLKKMMEMLKQCRVRTG